MNRCPGRKPQGKKKKLAALALSVPAGATRTAGRWWTSRWTRAARGLFWPWASCHDPLTPPSPPGGASRTVPGRPGAKNGVEQA